MKKLMLVLLISAFIASSASAGMTVRIYKNSPLYPEHRYVAQVISGPIGIYENGDIFKTFCMEIHESTNNAIFDVENIGDMAMLGGEAAGDPLDPMTAYLYTEFNKGTLTGLGYDYNSMASFEALQDVIWYIEDEKQKTWVDGDLSLRDKLYQDAISAGWTDIGSVRVMVLTQDGINRQDMLVMVPAPGAILLSSIGIGFVGWLRRRRKI